MDWIKIFNDNSVEYGDEYKPKTSWSKNLVNIKQVYLCGKRHSILLDIPDSYWHNYGRFVASMTSGEAKRIYKVLQVLIPCKFKYTYPALEAYEIKSELQNCGFEKIQRIYYPENMYDGRCREYLVKPFRGDWLTVANREGTDEFTYLYSDKGGLIREYEIS